MGILECASGASASKGYAYYKEGKVVWLEEIEEGIFEARVEESNDTACSVELHIDHPRKSKCNCPHADGKRIVCKHTVAAYFAALPEGAEKFYAEAMAAQADAEKYEEELYDRVTEYVLKMKKSELQEALLQLLFDGPEWQYKQFIQNNALDDDW